MKQILIILIALLFFYIPNSFAGLYSSGYSQERGTVIAAVQIKEEGLYNLVTSIQFLHRPEKKKIYSSNEYEKLIDRLLVESRGIALQIILDNNEISLKDLSGLKKDVETAIGSLATKLKKDLLPEQDADVVFSISDFYLLEPND